MIQIPQSSPPVTGFALDHPTDPTQDGNDLAPDGAQAEAPARGGDPVARYGAMNGLHSEVQHFAYASPDGAGGGGKTSASASKPADNDAASAAALKEARALITKGNKLLMQHRYNDAIKAFEDGFRTYPDRSFILNKASALFDAGRYAEAAQEYELYLSEPDAPRADEVRDMVEKAHAKLGGREVTSADIVESRRQFELGAKAVEAGNYQAALDAFDQAYELNPIADFKYNQAVCLEKLGRPYAAADRYQGFLAAKPDTPDAAAIGTKVESLRKQADAKPITLDGQAGGQEWMSRGNRLLFAHRYSEAIAAYDEGFRTYPTSAFLLNKGSALLDSGRYAEADLAYGQYLSDPDAPRADEARAAQQRARAHMDGREATATGVAESGRLFEEGENAYKAGRFEEALQDFEKSYELNPLADTKYNQAACLDMLGRRYAAAERYGSYLAEKPDAKDAAKVGARIEKLLVEADAKPITATGRAGANEWITRGNRLLMAHHYNEAVLAFQEGFRTYPDRAFILNEAAALLDGGRYVEADRAYERYLSEPDAPRADEARAAQERARTHIRDDEARQLFDQGSSAFAAGRYQEALDAFDQAYEKSPLPEFLHNQAACLEKLGRPYAAADRFEAYLAAKPDAKDAAEIRSKVEKLRKDADARPISVTGAAGGQEWMSRGNQLLFAHRYDEAVVAYEEGFRTYPTNAFVLNKASALLDGGRYAEADLEYGRYLSDPDAPRADEARAAQQRARVHMGGREATVTGIAESRTLFDRGTELYKAGKYSDALQAFDRSYALNPRALVRYNQAACLEMMGKRELAAQRYEAYIAEDPRAADVSKVQKQITKLRTDATNAARDAFDRGQEAYLQGNFKAAANAFAEAYEQKPLPQFLYNRAAALDMAGEKKDAVRNYQLYLSTAPKAADADKIRMRIHELLQATGDELMVP